VNPDTIGYVWTCEYDLNTLRVDGEIFESGTKKLRIRKYPDTCGRGFSLQRTARKCTKAYNQHVQLFFGSLNLLFGDVLVTVVVVVFLISLFNGIC